MSSLDFQTAQQLFTKHRTDRAGIREKPELASVCLICGSRHIDPDPNDPHKWVCRNCDFAFQRYECSACGKTIDSRDPTNPRCATCGEHQCICGHCSCPG